MATMTGKGTGETEKAGQAEMGVTRQGGKN
jgi:hypothetical protein